MRIKYFLFIILYLSSFASGVFAINQPPMFITPFARGVAVGDTLIFTLVASDPDGDILIWSADNLPPSAYFNGLTQTFSWIPGNAGTYPVTFSIDDRQGHVIHKKIEIEVVKKNEWFTVRSSDIKTDGFGKVFFVNDSVGWALGSYGLIVNTTDAGTTWITQKGRDPLNDYLDLYFTDEKNGWLVGYRGAIFHTNDGGKTWNKQSGMTDQMLEQVQFVDSTNGWINGDVMLLLTSDGGRTWNRSNDDNYFAIRNFYFLNRLLGWAVGDYGKILHTEDGGITWKAQASGTSNHLGKVYFVDSTRGWVSGDKGIILYTNNGGVTWTAQNSNTPQIIRTFRFINEKIGWALTYGMQIFRTIDGGNTWISKQLNVGILYDLFILNAYTAWLVGNNAIILKTTDGGENWSNQNSTPSNKLAGINFMDENNGWAVGFGGMVMHSNDGGVGWRQIAFDTNNNFSGVQFVDSLTGWIIHGYKYSHGGMFKTSDGGNTWVNQETHSTNAHLGLQFLNADTGWVVGDNGLLAHTTDGGNTWINQWKGSDQVYFLDVYFANSLKGWVVASEDPYREILSTTDGGATWNTLITQFSYLNAVTFTDTLNGWVAGWGGTIGHTSDGGKTWVKQKTGTTSALFDVHFVHSFTGWAVGDHGTIIQTKDGGETWTIQPSGVNWRLNKVYFPDPTTGFAVGEYGTILKLRRDDEHLIKPDIPYQTTIASQSSPVLISFSDGGGLKIQFTEGTVAGKSISVTYTQKAPSSVPASANFDKPAYYVDVSTTADNYKTSLVFKYTDDLVQKQAIKETELAAAYWDAQDSLWKSVPVSIDTSANTVTLTTTHLSLWALVSNKENLITGIDNTTDENALPLTYALYQNYPNPFNAATVISFTLPFNQHVTLTIFNILGQPVRRLINSHYQAGEHSITWDGKDDNGITVSSGIYLYQIKTDRFHQTKKLLILK